MAPPCKRCRGKGTVPRYVNGELVEVTCPTCDGTGEFRRER